jgi:hypothetical protein
MAKRPMASSVAHFPEKPSKRNPRERRDARPAGGNAALGATGGAGARGNACRMRRKANFHASGIGGVGRAVMLLRSMLRRTAAARTFVRFSGFDLLIFLSNHR